MRESLSDVMVRRKGPRMYRGEPIHPDEGDRTMLKLRPRMHQISIWKHALHLIKGLAISSGGYVSDKQPPTPGIRKLTTSPGGRNSRNNWARAGNIIRPIIRPPLEQHHKRNRLAEKGIGNSQETQLMTDERRNRKPAGCHDVDTPHFGGTQQTRAGK